MPDNPPGLSLVIPAYNEAERLGQTVPEIRDALDGLAVPGGVEVVVVDDGSRDGTADRARELLEGMNARVISYEPNRGKGRAVKVGMLEARGAIRLLSDADLSTPLAEIPRFLAAHRRGYSAVIGSRKRPGARVEIHQPLLRETMGKLFTFLSNVLVVSGVSDFTCGFKSFTARAAREVFTRLVLEDWSYDTEVIWRVRRQGLSLKEVPVRWRDDPRSRVSPMSDSVRSFQGILKLLRMRCNGDDSR